MFNWFFKRGINRKITEMHSSVNSSFSNVKEDIRQVSQWVSHFKNKHESHDKNIDLILKRLDSIEAQIQDSSMLIGEEVPSNSSKDFTEFDLKNWNLLTDVQQHLAQVILSLDKEEPDSWHTLKKIALELYPTREYNTVRTTISHYVRLLEEYGFVERKRIGNQSFVKITKSQLSSLKAEKDALNESLNSTKKRKKKKEN